MTADNLYTQMQGVQQQMQPYLDNYGEMPGQFQKGVNEAYQHNLPALRNAAGIEAQAYGLPGQLMEQYDQEFGGKTGISSMARMNSILSNMGDQFGRSNLAWNLADKSQGRIDDIVKNLVQQYTNTMDSFGMKHNMLMPQWQQTYSGELSREQSALDRQHQLDMLMRQIEADKAARANRGYTPSSWNTVGGDQTSTTSENSWGDRGSFLDWGTQSGQWDPSSGSPTKSAVYRSPLENKIQSTVGNLGGQVGSWIGGNETARNIVGGVTPILKRLGIVN